MLWKCSNSKTARTLHEFYVISLYSLWSFNEFWFLTTKTLDTSAQMPVVASSVSILVYSVFLEYLNHENIYFSSIEGQKEVKWGENDHFSAYRSFAYLHMQCYGLIIFYMHSILCIPAIYKLRRCYGRWINYNKSNNMHSGGICINFSKYSVISSSILWHSPSYFL